MLQSLDNVVGLHLERIRGLENYYLYRLAIWLVSICPLWLAHFVASTLAEISFVLYGPSRRVVYRNVEHVLPPGTSSRKLWSVARGAFRNFSYSVVDFFRIPRMTLAKADRYIADCYGWEYLQGARDSGVGGVFATVHMGSWELAGVYLGLRGVPLTAAALPHRDERINRIFLGNRESSGMEVVPIGGALAKLENAVARGRFVGLVVDRDINGHGPVVPFFGQPARVPNGHVLLALRTGAWIIPTVTYRRLDGKLVIDMAAPIITDPAHDDPDELVIRCLRVLEDFIRQHPDQWSMFYDLWKQ